MSEGATDVIDRLAGIDESSPLHAIRAARPETRLNAQKSYEALFHPKAPGGASEEERYAVAAFVAGLHRDVATLAFYGEGLARTARPGVIAALEDEAVRGATEGPYGSYPPGPLSRENKPGPTLHVTEANRKVLGARLAAALEHAHMLVFHPRDAAPPALKALVDAGWTTTDIVTLSQLVAFLSFQIRAVAGLRALAAAPARRA